MKKYQIWLYFDAENSIIMVCIVGKQSRIIVDTCYSNISNETSIKNHIP